MEDDQSEMVKKLITATVLFTVSLGATRCGAGQQCGKPPSLALTPCETAGVPEKARCGEYGVFENRDAKKGRKIKLKIVVLPATGKAEDKEQGTGVAREKAVGRGQKAGSGERASATDGDHLADPFVYIAGGPGSSAIEDAPRMLDCLRRFTSGAIWCLWISAGRVDRKGQKAVGRSNRQSDEYEGNR